MPASEIDLRHMSRALELAKRGEGYVEPNPMVGCVVAEGARILGEGWHRAFGGPHAEIEALRAAGADVKGASLYVTLEPCCHHGKTPPCTQSIREAQVRRVVVAQPDPFPRIAGDGIQQLRDAGIEVETGLLREQAAQLNAPYLQLVQSGRPWVIAKWAMSLDGKLATHSGASCWISNQASRAVSHNLRARVDAIVVGRNTVQRDDPLLTARPSGPRTATRVVLDSTGQLPIDSQLVTTIDDAPVLVAVGPAARPPVLDRLRDAGCEVFSGSAQDPGDRFIQLLDELGRRRLTNVLVEGGGQLLGMLVDCRLIDEVHVFIAPKIIGGSQATSIAGEGVAEMQSALQLKSTSIQQLDGDVYVRGRIQR